LRSWRILSLAVLALQDRLPYEGTQSSATLLGQIDIACILKTWRIKGALVCPWKGDQYTCLWVENAYPCGILEVVRQPWKSHLAEFGGFPARQGTASHNETGTQFGESRVFSYIPPLVQNLDIPIAVPRGNTFSYNYVSELDAFGWRTGLLDLLMASPADTVGAWGCATPRTGWVTQPSEVIAAHLQAIRAGRVAAQPRGRVVLSQYSYDPRVGHYLQMVSPKLKSCVSIGTKDLSGLERGSGSKHGAYLFLHWGLFEECKRCLPVRYLPPRAPK